MAWSCGIVFLIFREGTMTVIAAAVKGNRAAIGCDSKVSGLGHGFQVSSKIRKVRKGWIGVAGLASLLEDLKRVPEPSDDSTGAWASYLDRIRSRLAESYEETGLSSTALALHQNRIHVIHPSGVFHKTPENGVAFAAIGSGGSVALGGMQTGTRNPFWSPQNLVHLGVVTATKLDPGCGGKIIVKKN